MGTDAPRWRARFRHLGFYPARHSWLLGSDVLTVECYGRMCGREYGPTLQRIRCNGRESNMPSQDKGLLGYANDRSGASPPAKQKPPRIFRKPQNIPAISIAFGITRI